MEDIKPRGVRLYVIFAWIAFLLLCYGFISFFGVGVFGVLTGTIMLTSFVLGALCGILSLVLYYYESQKATKRSAVALPFIIFIIIFSIFAVFAILSLSGLQI